MNYLTQEQFTVIPIYQEKWRKIILSTEASERDKVTAAVNAFYTFKGKSYPNILFFDSPKTAIC